MENHVLVNMSTLTDMANSVRSAFNTTNLMSVADLSTSISQMGPKIATGTLQPSTDGYIVVNHNLGYQPSQIGLYAYYTNLDNPLAPSVNRYRNNTTSLGGLNAINMITSSCCNLLNSQSRFISVYWSNRSNRVTNTNRNSSSSYYNRYYYNVNYSSNFTVSHNSTTVIPTANNASYISTINETSFTTPKLSKYADYIWYAL